MKDQFQSAILPPLPIVGQLRLSTRDGKTLAKIEVVKGKRPDQLSPFFQRCFDELEQFLLGKRQDIKLPLDLSGLTPFQTQVLKVMKKIPFGKTTSYGDIAKKLNSKAYQAIGTACGKNPLMLIYPCHRVIGTKDLGGFAHGLPMKKELLKLEGSLR